VSRAATRKAAAARERGRLACELRSAARPAALPRPPRAASREPRALPGGGGRPRGGGRSGCPRRGSRAAFERERRCCRRAAPSRVSQRAPAPRAPRATYALAVRGEREGVADPSATPRPRKRAADRQDREPPSRRGLASALRASAGGSGATGVPRRGRGPVIDPKSSTSPSSPSSRLRTCALACVRAGRRGHGPRRRFDAGEARRATPPRGNTRTRTREDGRAAWRPARTSRR